MAAISPLNTLVRPWVKGQKITQPGIYSGVPMDVYHNDLCDGPSVSHSVLWKVEQRTAKHAFDVWYGNPNRAPPEDKPHLALGRAIHHLAAGEARFLEHFIVRPPKWDSWRKDEAKAWRGDRIREGFDVLTPEDVAAIRGVADAMNEHPTIQAGILKGLVECSIVWKDPVTGLWVKSRPDVIPVDAPMIADLKSTTDASAKSVTNRATDFGYHMQLAIADEGLWQVAGFRADDHTLVYVETGRPYCINVKPMPGHDIDYGRRQFRRSLDIFAECLKTGEWTGYRDDDMEGGLSSRYREVLAWQSKHGLLPEVNGRQPRSPINAPKTPAPAVDAGGEAI